MCISYILLLSTYQYLVDSSLHYRNDNFFSHDVIINFRYTVMAYIKCRWYEPAYQSEERGIIPAVWLEEHGGHQIVRWPPGVNISCHMKRHSPPKADWKIFLLIEILSHAGET